jgi:hypothetical protein
MEGTELQDVAVLATPDASRRRAKRLLAPLLALAALAGATLAASGSLATAPAGAVASASVASTPDVHTAVQGTRNQFANGALPEAADPYGTIWTLGSPYVDRIVLSGWSMDPSTTGAVRVDVAVDGVVTGGGSTGTGGYFDLIVPAPAGAVTACAIARNVGPGTDVQIGCRDLRPPPLSGGYGWMSTEPRGHPLRFDPCTTVTIAYNPAGGPAWGRSELDAAVAELRAASGLDLRVTTTSEPAAFGRPLVDLLRYGNTFSPILLGYSTPDLISSLAGGVAGLGGPSSAWGPDGRVSVSGIVIIDGPQAATLPTGWGAQATLAKLLAHELGHVLGLGHVNDTAQLMNPVIPSRAGSLGAGDRTGLAYLGTGSACRRRPPVPNAAVVAAATIGEVDAAGDVTAAGEDVVATDGSALAPDGLPEFTEHLTID